MNFILRFLSLLAAAIIFALMMLTFIDVGGRFFFNSPVVGAFEITRLAMGALIFTMLPVVCAHDHHIKVDLFNDFITGLIGSCLRLGAALISLLVLIIIAWRLWLQGDRLFEYGQTTQELLLPIGGMAYFMSVMASLSGLLLLLNLVKFWSGDFGGADKKTEAA